MKAAETKFKETEIGIIPKEWNVVDLEYLANFSNGKISPERKNFGKYPVYGANGIIGFSDKANSLENSIILGRVGAYCGSIYFSNTKSWVTDNAIKCNAKENSESKFLYYLLSILGLNERAGGSGQPLINQTILNLIKVQEPSLIEQKQIAKILSSLDDKIKLNRKINDSLERIASSLFKRWFVDFEFPDKDGKSYKSNDGKMIESEFGEIPDSWLIKGATNLLDFIKGVEPGARQYSQEKLNNYIDFFRVANIYSGRDSKVFIDKDISKNIYTNFNDVLITTDGTVGRVATGLEGAYSGGIRKVLPKKDSINNSFIYFWLKSEYVQNILQEYASDSTTIAHASGAIRDMKIIFNDEIFEKFSLLTANIFNNILNNLKEVKNLEYIRDSILPRLMSGKIRVKI